MALRNKILRHGMGCMSSGCPAKLVGATCVCVGGGVLARLRQRATHSHDHDSNARHQGGGDGRQAITP